jgi:hypothetical protein
MTRHFLQELQYSGTIFIMTEPNKPERSAVRDLKRMLMVTFSVGCLTFLIAVGAIVAGVLIDLRSGTMPRWTLLLLLFSAPITLGMVYLLVRRVLQRTRSKAGGDAVEEEEPDRPPDG